MAGDREVVRVELKTPATVHGCAYSDVEADEVPSAPTKDGRAVRFIVDKPTSLGGTDQGPMPSEYLLAAIGSCMLMTAHKVAAKRKTAYAALEGDAFADIEGNDIKSVHLAFRVRSEAELAAWETIFRLAEKTCTISRACSVPMTHAVAMMHA